MEGVQKWELRERDIRLLYFVVGSSILLEFFSKVKVIHKSRSHINHSQPASTYIQSIYRHEC